MGNLGNRGRADIFEDHPTSFDNSPSRFYPSSNKQLLETFKSLLQICRFDKYYQHTIPLPQHLVDSRPRTPTHTHYTYKATNCLLSAALSTTASSVQLFDTTIHHHHQTQYHNGLLQQHGIARAAPIQPPSLPWSSTKPPSASSAQVWLKWSLKN